MLECLFRGMQMRWSAPLEAKAFTEASRQHGLLTREQLKALGASDRTIARRSRAGLWERLFPGVFRLLPSASSGWHQRLMGVCLWLGDRGLAGLRTFRQLLAQRGGTGPKDSEAERLFYRNVIDAYGLPRPEHNYRVKDRQGKFVAKVDAAYPQYGIAIEIYSKAHHTSPEAVQNDARRQNELVMAGMTPLIFWWEDITAAPHRTAERIAETITLKTGEELLLRSD